MKIRRWLLAIGLSLLVIAVLAGIKGMQIKSAIEFAESMPEHSETVESVLVSTQDYAETVLVLGEVVAPQKVDLNNELAGRIARVNFLSGSNVEKNQLLIQLDIREETAQLKSAKARAELASAVYSRIVNLRENSAISEEREDQARADFKVVEAEIEALKSVIDKKTIRAPFAGATGIHQLEVGQYLQQNSLVTTIVGDTEFVWIDFELPQFYHQVEVGDRVQALLASRALILDAEIVARNSVINSTARSLQYRAQLALISRDLPANTILEVVVPVSETRTYLTVPSIAVMHDHKGQYVFELEASEVEGAYIAKRRSIEIAARKDDQWVMVESGLEPGEHIATAGAFKLHDGLLVYTRDVERGPGVISNGPSL